MKYLLRHCQMLVCPVWPGPKQARFVPELGLYYILRLKLNSRRNFTFFAYKACTIKINKKMKRGDRMNKVLDLMAAVLAKVTFVSAVAGAESASLMGMYQPKTPEMLTKKAD